MSTRTPGYLSLLIDISLKQAAQLKGSLRDLFLGQAARLESELKEMGYEIEGRNKKANRKKKKAKQSARVDRLGINKSPIVKR